MEDFVGELAAFASPQAFNPWRDYHFDTDISPDAPEIRRAHLKQYLRLRKEAKYLFVAEAVGYQGGRFSGVALTSERMLMGKHPDVSPAVILGDHMAGRTSNPASPHLKPAQRASGFAEPTATVVWKEIFHNGLSPFDVILWNIFPFHPYDAKKGLLSNRTPAKEELAVGAAFFGKLLSVASGAEGLLVVAIGGHAAETLAKMGVAHRHVPHPSNGGTPGFRRGMRGILTENNPPPC
ncbi:uracil-DNA glycosylase [Heliobacterium undosum]|uniref:Uracil-DNA glycosylase n=1 Tax=Heliomicrobium undosum TaxID=121734 RepID=A0A845L1R6_9FIRM|nr:uracil-DNA glycosylase [Heliomicrobium undosum]